MAEPVRKETYLIKLSLEEKEKLKDASKKSGTLMSRLIRETSLKEADRILKQIEKGK